MGDADLARAIAIAAVAHANQLDKAGKAYVTHPIRVMQASAQHGTDAQIVAVLHDVVEDTWVTLGMLRDWGFTGEIVEAVDAISQRKGQETFFEYIARCSQNRLATLVKLADLDDNSLPERRFGSHFDALLRKYEKARRILRDALDGRG